MHEQNRAGVLHRVLEKRATDMVPQRPNLWPRIAAQLQGRQRRRAWTPAVPHTRLGWVAVGLALFLVLGAAVTTTATAGVLIQDDPEPPADLQDAVGSLFSAGQCVTGAEAADGIRARLDSLGYEEWATVSRQGVESDGCVVAGFHTPEKLIVLVPVDRPEVVQAVEGVAKELRSRCLDEEQATELLSSVLATMGVTNASIRSDGPFAYRIDQKEAVLAHVAAGCFVFSGSGRDAAGQPVYYISGPGFRFPQSFWIW